jgi:WD repeat-containing protein 42A
MPTSALLRRHRRANSSSFAKSLNSSHFLPISIESALVLNGHHGCINTCSFNPYGDLQLTGCDDGCVWLWDIGSRCEIPQVRLRPHATNVFTTNFLSHHRFISGANDALVHVTELTNDGRAVGTRYEKHHIRKVHSSFVVDENTFVTCAHDSTVRLFDVRTHYRNSASDALPILTAADFAERDRMRLSNDLDRFNLLPQGNGGGLRTLVPPGEIDEASLLLDLRGRRASELFQIDVHPIDRKRFLTCGCDGTVRLFDMRMIRRRDAAERGFSVVSDYGVYPMPQVTGATFDATGHRIAASVFSGDIHVFDADDVQDLTHVSMERGPIAGETARLVGRRSEETIKSCNWFGEFVVSGSDCGDVYFFDPESTDIVQIVSGHQMPTNVVAVNAEKKLLATSGVDEYATLWEPRVISRADRRKVAREIRQKQEENDRAGPVFACQVM